MLLYLNNAESRKEHPNQNWARQLLELYTLGPGHYSEADILAAARAFTGWTVRLKGGLNPREADANVPWEFAFRPAWHDPGPKTFLGQRVEGGEEVLEVLIAHPETYRFLSRNMVEEGARVLRSEGTRGFLRWLFTHEAFYHPSFRNSLIKGPLEYLVGLLYAAGIREWPADSSLGKGVYQALATMGQIPFDPPTVAGWEGGPAWLAETPYLARLNLISVVANQGKSLDLSVFMEGGKVLADLMKPEAQLL